MKLTRMTDLEIIAAIRKGKREKPIRQLYKEFPKIRILIVSSGCREVLAKEIFNDSLVLLIEKVSNPEFQLTSKLTTYLYGINRFLLQNVLRKEQKNNREVLWEEALLISDEELSYDFEKEEKMKSMEKILATVSEKCRKIFQLFYYEQRSMDYIAGKLGFSSVNSAKTQKYKCLERAHQLSQEIHVSSENLVS